ncbi:MAG: hypothetical protein ACYCSP_08375 [Acidobacteriaceae bacterium]
MMQAIEILDTVSAAGGQLWLKGDRVCARLPESLRPLVSVIRERKPELIDLLTQRPVMPSGVRLLSYAPVTAPFRLSRCETVMDTGRFIQSTLRLVDARLHDRHFLAGNWTLSELLARLTAVGCHVALDDRKTMLQ